MDSPPQTVTVRGGDFFCGKSGRKLCRVWSCGENASGVGEERLVWENQHSDDTADSVKYFSQN